MTKKYKISINNHYTKLIKKHGFNIKGLGWGKGRLNKRYKIITQGYNLKNKSVLDFGCGLCNFFDYLKEKKIKIKNYNGVEINPKIRKFLFEKYKNKFSIYDKMPAKKFDIIVSNGIHNYKTIHSEKIFYTDINKLLKITREVLIISFIIDNVDYKENHLSYKNLFKTIRFIQKKNLNFIINQTLNKYETFLFVIK